MTLKQNMFVVTEPDRFEPSARDILAGTCRLGGRGYVKCVQNPTKSEFARGIYKPRLTLTGRIGHHGYEVTLQIDFSAPKLLKGNNFEELTEPDKTLLIDRLWNRLAEMGILTSRETLLHASVSQIHYSKNILLLDYSTASYYISLMVQANTSRAIDINKSDYRNGGSVIKLHANTYEFVVYDKVQDLKQSKVSEKRSIEKDNTIQLSLLQTIDPQKPFEVLRIEARLHRSKLLQLLRKIGIQEPPTFNNLFRKEISQAILTRFIDIIEKRLLVLQDYSSRNLRELLSTIIVQNPGISTRKALQLIGMRLCLEEMCPREIRNMFYKENKRGWYRLVADANSVKRIPRGSPFQFIRNQIEKFDPVKLVDFDRDMINNDKHINE